MTFAFALPSNVPEILAMAHGEPIDLVLALHCRFMIERTLTVRRRICEAILAVADLPPGTLSQYEYQMLYDSEGDVATGRGPGLENR